MYYPKTQIETEKKFGSGPAHLTYRATHLYLTHLPNCQKSVKHAGTSICGFIDSGSVASYIPSYIDEAQSSKLLCTYFSFVYFQAYMCTLHVCTYMYYTCTHTYMCTYMYVCVCVHGYQLISIKKYIIILLLIIY